MISVLKIVACIIIVITISACVDNKQNSTTSQSTTLDFSSAEVQRSRAMRLHSNTLYFTSPHTQELIAWDRDSKSTRWKQSLGRGLASIDIDLENSRLFVAATDAGFVSSYTLNGELINKITQVQQPVGVMWVEELQHLFVTDQALNQLIVFDANLDEKYRISIVGAPRGLAFSPSTRQLFVSCFLSDKFASVSISASKIAGKISLTIGEVNYHHLNFHARLAQNIQIYGQQILIPHTQSNSETLNLVFDRTVAPRVSAFNLSDLSLDTQRVIALDTIDRTVNNPIDIAVDRFTGNRWVLNAGTNDISVISDRPTTLVAHIGIAKKPHSILLDDVSRRAYVVNSLSYSVTEINMDSHMVIDEYPVTNQVVSSSIQLGMEMFFLSTDPRIARDRWVTCAICHPDAKQDGLVWRQGLGPRNSTSMEGLASTGQLHWSGDRDEVQDFEHTFQGLMGGTGFLISPPAELAEQTTGLSAELDALADFVLSLPFPVPLKSAFLDLNAVARGQVIFHRQDTNCTQCHVGNHYTNSSTGAQPPPENNVGTQVRLDDFIKSGNYDTPSLRGLAFSSPYLHDGSAATLHEIFTAHNTNDLHGISSQLSKVELDDLVEFLNSL